MIVVLFLIIQVPFKHIIMDLLGELQISAMGHEYIPFILDCHLLPRGSYPPKSHILHYGPSVKAKTVKPFVDVTVRGGHKVVLKCEANQNGATAKWLKNNKKVSEIPNVTITQNNKKLILTIKQDRRSDRGTYTCEVSGEKVMDIAPQVISTLQHQEVCIGAKITLSCEVDKSGATATWKKDGETLSQNERIKMCQRDRIFTLTIEKAKLADGGVYSIDCVKKHIGSVQCSARVTIKEEFDKPWRTFGGSKQDEVQEVKRMFEELCSLRPKEVPLRILVHGPPGAGKSSFINSIDSIFKGFISSGALADGIGGKSFTTRYRTFQFQRDEDWMPFVICDTKGLEEKGGMDTEVITKILQGHVKDKYKFHSDSTPSDQDRDYNPNPSLTDKVHCLVSVVPANTISLIEDDVFKKMRAIREAASDMGIPQVVIMTKVDDVCPLVKDDLKKIYRSAKVKEKIEVCHNALGVPMCFIYPVKNYHEENSLNPEVNHMLLDAVNSIMKLANDYMNALLSSFTG
ncbi:titin-like [Chanos chanos]|uniref:Titin-like n=1 Tax=Chanos chanos TaxID=29144 RepID=A0A6J2W783_CHACN|nr:titin-like [Chanos chanos]